MSEETQSVIILPAPSARVTLKMKPAESDGDMFALTLRRKTLVCYRERENERMPNRKMKSCTSMYVGATLNTVCQELQQ